MHGASNKRAREGARVEETRIKGGCQRETGAGRAPKVAAAGKRAAAVSIPVAEEEQGAGVAGIACWEQTVFWWV